MTLGGVIVDIFCRVGVMSYKPQAKDSRTPQSGRLLIGISGVKPLPPSRNQPTLQTQFDGHCHGKRTPSMSTSSGNDDLGWALAAPPPLAADVIRDESATGSSNGSRLITGIGGDFLEDCDFDSDDDAFFSSAATTSVADPAESRVSI